MNKKYLMLCKKKVKTKDGKSFDVVFGYRQILNEKGEYEDVKSLIFLENGETKDIAKSVKVALADSLRKKLDAEDKYPYRLVLNEEFKLPDGRDSFYVSINKDKEGNPKLDNKGHKHAIIVIRDVESYEAVPLQSLTLEDIDDIC